LSDTNVYEPQIRARLGTAAHFCEVVVLRRGRPLLRIDHWPTILKLTCWGCGTNPSTLGLRRADLGAEEGELHGLVVLERADRERLNGQMTVLYYQMTVVHDQMTVLLTALEHS